MMMTNQQQRNHLLNAWHVAVNEVGTRCFETPLMAETMWSKSKVFSGSFAGSEPLTIILALHDIMACSGVTELSRKQITDCNGDE